MRYRRVLALVEQGADAGPALGAVRALAPAAESLGVVACPPPRPRPWLPGPAAPAPAGLADAAWLDRLRQDAAPLAPRLAIGAVPDLDPAALAALAGDREVDLVVAGPLPAAGGAALSALRRLRPVAVAWVPSAAAAAAAQARGPARELLCVAPGERARAALAAFLRDHGDPAQRVTLLSLAPPSRDEVAVALEVAGIRAPVELAGGFGAGTWRTLETVARERRLDLVVLSRFPGALLRGAPWPAPVLVLPPAAPVRSVLRRPLDVPDLLDGGGPVRLRVGYAYGLGRNPPVEDQELALVSDGRVVARVRTCGGEAELPAGLAAGSIGVFRARDAEGLDPVAAVERQVAVLRPGALPLLPFDAELGPEDLALLAGLQGAEPLAVRLRPTRSCHLVRERLCAAGLAPRVVDASAVLDEGEAADVGEAHDAVRLARVGGRLRAAGFPVAAIVHRGPHPPAAIGFEALEAHQLAGRAWRAPPPAPRPGSLDARLDAATAAPAIEGNRVELELENATARRWLLEAIRGARRTLHLQVYLATDDDAGRRVEAALAGAGRRGVAVRVLVDSLHGLHGSFGLENPLLARLAARPGVEVRVSRPVAAVPSVEDLKRRDHRKLVVADGAVALVGGRNLAHEYYTGFDEVRVGPRTPWREVPWLDGGARVRGPAVAAVERAFLEAWTGAGGAPFEVTEPGAAGAERVRVVVHRGLRDASTLEAYLALVESARSRLVAVNGFPLLLELEHALARALRRGVRVQVLFGEVTPTHGGEPFEGPWATARTAATWLVHSRIDTLVAAGAEAWLLAVRDVPGWSPELGLVRPHVHAKAMIADGRACAVGSANLDVTASYWEDELLLVVEDEAVAGAFEARVQALLAGSTRVDRGDPAWQRRVRARDWARHWPGILSI
ncbi:phospholipase D-like domain-containing protein [Anaeromyxobacter sp. Red801]|uniref:phospholipase D-like domain-containing protein n=1 Tax=Anaeromyxobacter sp. Red801 TaxID=3411632 RepID=UPI003BA3CD1E